MRTALTLITAFAAATPCVADWTYEISGTYTLDSGDDVLGLDGATFTLTFEVACDAEPDFWIGPPDNAFHFTSFDFLPTTLTLSGTAGGTYDGTYVEPGGSLILRRGVFGANDFVEHLSPGFDIGGEDLDMDYQVHFPPGDFFPGIDPLQQAPYTMADVDFVNTSFEIDDIFTPTAEYVSTDIVATAMCDCCCIGDLDGGGGVGFGDLVALLAAWGPCAGCPEDLDGSGDVGFADLVIMLSAWGPCP